MEHRHYLVRKRCQIEAICGPVNLPYGTLAICNGGIISMRDGRMICRANSQTARDYFSVNDDGMGAIRGRLVQSIMDALQSKAEMWDRVWEDPVCLKFKDPKHSDYFLWDISFYEAEIEELVHINNLVGGIFNV